MTQETLSPEDFDEALDLYERLLARGAGAEDFPAVVARADRKIDGMYAGFSACFQQYVEDERDKFIDYDDIVVIQEDGAVEDWYYGPRKHSGEWPLYRAGLTLDDSAVEAVDRTTSRILSLCANPETPGERRKGLVVGYVQSGKTANYAGLIAKAVDAGYRIVIVLAGMHTNLRVQTQNRLQRDLSMDKLIKDRAVAWNKLTGPESDIGKNPTHGMLSMRGNVVVMVVKKNASRLANTAKFLHEINEDDEKFLLDRPVLIIDDESDQATPNTLAGKNAVSSINQHVRNIWAEVKTGSYVAYTATPFANVFIDPDDAGDLYPDDFVVALPKPVGYMGADRFFDTSQVVEDDQDTIYSLARDIPEEEAEILAPTGRDLTSYDPSVTDSLEKAIRWFLISTAVRQLRDGERRHSSMLVHTSHRTEAHEKLAAVIREDRDRMQNGIDELEEEFRALYESEIDQAAGLKDSTAPDEWLEVWEAVRSLVGSISIVVDNGISRERLVYSDERPQTVIAIGGGTLSRGLTLEGLIVSFFLRTSNTYDTLLQMGRWFGFRPGYADLVRVWVGPGLLEDYSHLARVERELRDDIELMDRENRTPRDMAVKVLAHPGRLEITAPSKMSAAVLAQAGLGGTRRQTIYLDSSAQGARAAQEAASALVASLRGRGVAPVVARGAANSPLLFRGVKNEDVLSFLESYWVAPSDRWLQADAMGRWLAKHGEGISWNMVLASGSGPGSSRVTIGGAEVGTVTRSPLSEKYWDPSRLTGELPMGSRVVNIRTLMAGGDQMLDLRILSAAGELTPEQTRIVDAVDVNNVVAVREARRVVAERQGLLVIYVVDKDSKPASDSPARRQMGAEEHPVGIGVVFPSVDSEVSDEFWSVDLGPDVIDDGSIAADLVNQPDGEADHVVGEDR